MHVCLSVFTYCRSFGGQQANFPFFSTDLSLPPLVFCALCNCCFSGFMILSVNITEANYSSVFTLSCRLPDVLFFKHFKEPLYWIFFSNMVKLLWLWKNRNCHCDNCCSCKYCEFNLLHNMLYCALWSNFKCVLYSPAIPLHRHFLSLFKSSTWMANQNCSLIFSLHTLHTSKKNSIKQRG